MPTSTVASRPASRRCNIASSRVTDNASSAGSFHGTILGPPVCDGMLCKTPSWPKGRFHAKITFIPKEPGTKVFSESADLYKNKNISDNGVKELAKLKQLKELHLAGTQI